MARVRIRRNATTGQVAPPTGANIGQEGELHVAHGGFTGLPLHNAAGNDLIVYLNNGYRTVVGPTRQVELIGDQNIAGNKTFTTRATFADPTNLSIGNGNAGEVLTSNGTGGTLWGPGGAGGIDSVLSDGTLDGDGANTALSVTIARDGQRGGVIPVAGSAVAFSGTGGLTVTVADDPAIAGGTNNVFPIASAGLRSQMGLDAPTGLHVGLTARTVVPAINELKNAIDALQGQLHFGGGYDVDGDNVTPSSTPGNPFSAGPLEDPPADSEGWFLICTSAATIPPGEVPPEGNYGPGDWLIVDGGLSWVHIPLGAAAVHVDGVSIKGTGLTPDPGVALYVDEVDGGTFP